MLSLNNFLKEVFSNYLLEDEQGIAEPNSSSRNAGGVLHELLTGYYLNGGKRENVNEQEAHMPKHEDIDGLSPHEAYLHYSKNLTPKQLEKAHELAQHAANYLREHAESNGDKISHVHWTSKPGDIERSTGISSTQKEDPSDIVITTESGKHIGVSLKRSGSTRNVPIANPGSDSIHKGRETQQELRNAVVSAIPEIGSMSNKEKRKAFLRQNPKSHAKAKEIVRNHLAKMSDNTAEYLRNLRPEELAQHLRENVLHAHTTPMQEQGHEHMRLTTWDSAGGPSTSHIDPGQHYEHILQNPENIIVQSTGQGVGFYIKHPETGKMLKFAGQNIKIDSQSDPMSTIKSSTQDNFNAIGETKSFMSKKQKATKSKEEAGSGQHGPVDFHSKDELRPVNENIQLHEATSDPNKQTHLEHIEDLAYDGHDGVGLADQHLRQMHNYLLGAKRNTPDRVETKVDGAPAFHIFKDNEGRIGVGTKSMFNKNPKLNFTDEDIDANHGHAPGLAAVLKQTLAHAHKMVPPDMKPGEIYKGDFLFGDGSSGRDVESGDDFHEFQPNTLRYKVPKDSPEGARIGNAKVGVALHTYFGPDGVAGPIDKKRRAKLLDHPDVYNYDPSVQANPVNHTPVEQRAFEEHMENARKAYNRIKPEVYDDLTGHDQHMRTYTNKRVREGAEGPGNVDEYLDFLNQKAQKDIGSVKTQAAKDRKTKQHAALMQQVVQNAKHVQNIFDLHNHLQNAKNTLIGVAGKNSGEAVELPDGSATGHEGYVSTIKTDGGQHQGKFVDRAEFSRANFAQGSFQKPVQESLEEGIIDRLKGVFNAFRGNKTNAQNHHLVWGRMNPIHAGHELVMGAAQEAAKGDNGNVSLVLSGTQDKTKNPLSPEQKVKHAKRAFPGVDVSVADKSSPTILHQATKLFDNGVKNLTVHVGSDRVDQFKSLLHNYNGVEGKGHGFYQFHNINVVPAGGERDEEAEGVSGASATKMRQAAADGDREAFHAMAPSNMKPEHKDEMMADVQAGMTRKESLSSYLVDRFKMLSE